MTSCIIEIKSPTVGSVGAGCVALVVDDDEACCYAIERSLRARGFETIPATRFTEALGALDDLQRKIDVLVADVRMPGQPHGFALAAMARQRRRFLPIIFVSGYPEYENDAGEHRFLLKPIEADELARQVVAAAGGPR